MRNVIMLYLHGTRACRETKAIIITRNKQICIENDAIMETSWNNNNKRRKKGKNWTNIRWKSLSLLGLLSQNISDWVIGKKQIFICHITEDLQFNVTVTMYVASLGNFSTSKIIPLYYTLPHKGKSSWVICYKYKHTDATASA